MPGCEQPAQTLDQQAAAHPEHADQQHADHDVGVVLDGVGLPGVIADAELAGDHFRRHQAEPRGAHADGQAGDDARRSARKNDLQQDGPAPCPEAFRRGDQPWVDAFDAVHGVEQDREQCAGEGDEHHRQLRRGKHQDRQGNPRHRRDRTQHFQGWQQQIFGPFRAADGQAQGHANDQRREVTGEHPAEAAAQVLRELARVAEAEGGFNDRHGCRDVGEGHQAKVPVVAGGKLPEQQAEQQGCDSGDPA